MRILTVKCFALILAFSAAQFSAANMVQAAEVSTLKVSRALSLSFVQNKAQSQVVAHVATPGHGLLGRVSLFRGVVVNDENSTRFEGKAIKSGAAEPKESRRSMINAMYGGLQISLQENLSLIYAPGRLSGGREYSDSQGLYLLTNRGGLANWFMGVETRRTTNTAQFGVIMELD